MLKGCDGNQGVCGEENWAEEYMEDEKQVEQTKEGR